MFARNVRPLLHEYFRQYNNLLTFSTVIHVCMFSAVRAGAIKYDQKTAVSLTEYVGTCWYKHEYDTPNTPYFNVVYNICGAYMQPDKVISCDLSEIIHSILIMLSSVDHVLYFL